MVSVNDIWDPSAVLLKFDVDMDGSLNYKEFRTLCVELFGADEVKENEWRAREIFELFDTNADGLLNEHDLHRCHSWILDTLNPVNVLLIVDVQNDFIDGTLALRNLGACENGEEVIEPINRLLRDGRWDKVIYSQDWHPENHISFFDNLMMRKLHPESKITQKMAKLFDTVVFLQPHLVQKLWPKHCVMDTWGAELHKDLLIVHSSEQVRKGRNPDKEAYSVFSEKHAEDLSELESILSTIHATHLYVCGLAYDICVKETCLDGLRLGHRLAIIDDCCRGVYSDSVAVAKGQISENGGLIAHSDQVLSFVNEGKRSLVMAHHAAKKTSL